MNVMDSWDARTKFEEDIKMPFVSLYSFSTTFKTGDGAILGELGDQYQGGNIREAFFAESARLFFAEKTARLPLKPPFKHEIHIPLR
jgi:hypothetical protein